MAKNNVLLGLLAGAAAGALAGILLAPEKGSETRKNLSKKSKDTFENLKGKMTDLVDNVSDKYMANRDGNNSSSFDQNLERTRSTASSLNTGEPGQNAFT